MVNVKEAGLPLWEMIAAGREKKSRVLAVMKEEKGEGKKEEEGKNN